MRYFKKKNSEIFSPEGPRENVSPGPAVALDGPGYRPLTSTPIMQLPLPILQNASAWSRLTRLAHICISSGIFEVPYMYTQGQSVASHRLTFPFHRPQRCLRIFRNF